MGPYVFSFLFLREKRVKGRKKKPEMRYIIEDRVRALTSLDRIGFAIGKIKPTRHAEIKATA